jgi:hypothetical protein
MSSGGKNRTRKRGKFLKIKGEKGKIEGSRT